MQTEILTKEVQGWGWGSKFDPQFLSFSRFPSLFCDNHWVCDPGDLLGYGFWAFGPGWGTGCVRIIFGGPQKGASGKGRLQKTSKSVINIFDAFRHFSRRAKKRQKSSKSVKNIFDIFDNSRAAPVFRPLLGASDILGAPTKIYIYQIIFGVWQEPPPAPPGKGRSLERGSYRSKLQWIYFRGSCRNLW